MRSFLICILFPVFCIGQQFSQTEINRCQATSQRVTIVRDNWGVPHIYGKTDADAVFGLMYAQCEENFSQVEENNLEMLGRLSEKYGSDHLYSDLEMQIIYDTTAAIRDYQHCPSWFRKLLDACADGVNYYLYKHPEVKPAVLHRFEPWYALLRTDGSISATQTGGLTMNDLRSLYKEAQNTSMIRPELPFFDVDPTGSNGFALAPSKTASGNAMLYINPHVSFYFRAEVQMVSDEGLDVYGAVTWGNFFVYQGFNEHCGWMHTSSYADVADLFIEKTEEKGNDIFSLYNGKWEQVKKRPLVIRYLENNTIKEQPFLTYVTLHGPVMGSRNGQWLSLKENNRSLDALMQSWLRTKARGFDDFKKVMNMRSNNSNNTVFADDKGNIAYWHGNFMPKRDTRFDYSLPVDGSIAASNWKGIHNLDEIVHVYNPATGWIQNCNSTPFTCSGTSSPKKQNYPSYMAPDGQNFRAINAMRLLSKPGRFTMDQLINEVGYSHYLSAFEILLPALISAYDQLPQNDTLKDQLEVPMHLLKNWDYNASSSSIASSLAIEWAYRMAAKASPASNPYKISDGVGQVQSMITNTTPRQRLELLIETMNDLQKRFGNWRTAWGDINRYQRPADGNFDDSKWSLPVGQAAGNWGSIPSFATRRFAQTNKRYGVSGNSFIACVDFGKKLKAKSVITGGQSFDPASPNNVDQASMYINGRFKDVLFYKEDVMKHAVRQYHPGE